MRYILALLLSLTLAMPAFAGFNSTSATDSVPTTKVKEITQAALVKTAEPETTCVLTGNITEQEQRDRYIFKDESGTITVKIAPQIFGNNDVNPNTRVKLVGEVNKKKRQSSNNEVKVRYLELIH